MKEGPSQASTDLRTEPGMAAALVAESGSWTANCFRTPTNGVVILDDGATVKHNPVGNSSPWNPPPVHLGAQTGCFCSRIKPAEDVARSLHS